MSKLDKLIKKIQNGRNITYAEAEKMLLELDFKLNIKSSHHVFRKEGYHKIISLKKRSQLIAYQIDDLQEVLKDHGY